MSDPQLDRLLRELDAARGAALARADAALRGRMPSEPRSGPVAVPQAAPVAPAAPPVSASGPAPGPAAPPSPASRWLHTAARPVAALVLTAVAVLGGWLLVLEPALGSRPVLVRDEMMSPSLRTGDVALAVAPDGPLGAGAIVAVRRDDRTVVTRVIGREDVPADAPVEARAAAGLIVRADSEPLEVSAAVPLDDLVGEVGAAVPRVGLPVVLLADPTGSPLGALLVLVLLALTAVGAADLVRERRTARE